MGLIALGAVGVTIYQYKLAEKSLHGQYLLQLARDSKETSNIVSTKTPNIDNVVAKECVEKRGDLNYSDIYAQAKYELDGIIDFYELYYTAYSKYDLITKDTWLQVCDGSESLSDRNCFYKKEWKNAIDQREGLSNGLAMCHIKQG